MLSLAISIGSSFGQNFLNCVLSFVQLYFYGIKMLHLGLHKYKLQTDHQRIASVFLDFFWETSCQCCNWEHVGKLISQRILHLNAALMLNFQSESYSCLFSFKIQEESQFCWSPLCICIQHLGRRINIPGRQEYLTFFCCF